MNGDSKMNLIKPNTEDLRKYDPVAAADRPYEPFPDIDPGIIPLGSRVLVQIRTPRSKTVGGILTPIALQDEQLWTTQHAKVRSLGPLAFKRRSDGVEWPEGAWVKVGDHVRIPRHGTGDRWWVRDEETGQAALFSIWEDHNLIGLHTGDPERIATTEYGG